MASGTENNYKKVNWNCSCKWTGKLRNCLKHKIYEDFERLLQGPREPSDPSKQTKVQLRERKMQN